MVLSSKWLLRFFLFIVILVVGIFAVNWLKTYFFENHLKKMLAERVSEATNGFYKLSYDKLSVGLFNGELNIQGVELNPDSAVFVQWAARDSLPNTYVKLYIKEIDFRGVNLTWLFNRSELHFELFEVSTPHVVIVNAYESNRHLKTSKNKDSKTLYEMVSPYTEVISAKEINLIDADISFVIEDPAEPTIYALRKANFRAYDFILNDKSSESGKLLYSDNFEFFATENQLLLSDPQFSLAAGNIRLSTRDSVIAINDVALTPKQNVADTLVLPGTYVDAKIKAIDAKGIWFKREKGLNYLDTRLFEIYGSDIHYQVVQNENKDLKEQTANVPDSTLQIWSLYEIVSPILSSVSIESIGLRDAGFKYTQKGQLGTDNYVLNRLDFTAKGFLLDSLSDVSHGFMYLMNYKLEAVDMQAHVNSMNHNLNIDRVFLDTENGIFKVENVNLDPISVHNRYDYIQGSIDSITLSGLDYNMRGVSAADLGINTPNIRYVRNAFRLLPGSDSNKSDTVRSGSTFDDFLSIVGELNIKDIRLRKANLIFDDLHANDRIRYRLDGLNFYAKDFIINEGTRNSVFGFFDCSNLGFDFRNFDNYLPGKDYRLKIAQARFSHIDGRLSLKNIRLIPQKETWKNAPDAYYALFVPSFEIVGLNHRDKIINTRSIKLDSPRIDIVKLKQGKEKETATTPHISFLDRIMMNKVGLNDLSVNYKDAVVNDSTLVVIKSLQFDEISWNKAGNKITLGEFDLRDGLFNISRPSVKTDVIVPEFKLSGLDWNIGGNNRHIKINKVGLYEPLVIYAPFASDTLVSVPADKESGKSNEDIYTKLGRISEKIFVNNIKLVNGNFNYATESNKFPIDKLNNINLNVDGLVFDRSDKVFDVKDLDLVGSDLKIPVNDGFYTLHIGNINLTKKDSKFLIDSIHLNALYPKMEFAYKHPKHKDWFDVTVGKVQLKNIDFPLLLSGEGVKADSLSINNVMLQNFKNQQIEIEHNVMPLIYENLQKAPIKIDIAVANAENFSVIYEELPKNKNTAGVIKFNGMNGHFTGLTNIVKHPDQYIRLDADGKFMGDSPFKATWMMPVDSLNDCFYLAGNLGRFDLKDLNQLIEPLAGARVERGVAVDTKFDFEASSYSAQVNMTFLYNDLRVNILKGKDEDNLTTNKFATSLANLIILPNNPKRENAQPKQVSLHMIRDPYHSTFNYFWQILQPALGESVGVSQGTQNFAKGAGKVFKSIKNFFSFGKKKNTEDNKNKE